MSADVKSAIGVVTTLLAFGAFWVAYQSWDAHVELGDSHGPFLFVAVVALVVGTGLGGLSLWLFTSDGKHGAANDSSRAADEEF